MKLLQQHRLAERRVMSEEPTSTLSILELPGGCGDGMLITRGAQHSHQITLMVQHCVRDGFSGGRKGAEQHLLPHTCIKELCG